MRIGVPFLREVSMLVLGSAGMARELFLVPVAEMSMVRVTISAVLMMGPAALWVWWRAKLSANTPSERGSQQPASRSPSDG